METKSAIIQAVQNGEISTLSELLDAQPDLLYTRTEQGTSLILWAIYHRQTISLEVLLARKPNLDIFEASALGNINRVQELLKENPTLLNVYAEDGFYPLGLAVYFVHNDLAKWFIEQGANVNQKAQNQAQVAPIHAAVSSNNWEIAEYLIAKGANVNQVQQQNFTPLHGAAHNGNLLIVRLLIENGADLSLRTQSGKTALQLAEEAEKNEVIAYLKTIIEV